MCQIFVCFPISRPSPVHRRDPQVVPQTVWGSIPRPVAVVGLWRDMTFSWYHLLGMPYRSTWIHFLKRIKRGKINKLHIYKLPIIVDKPKNSHNTVARSSLTKSSQVGTSVRGLLVDQVFIVEMVIIYHYHLAPSLIWSSIILIIYGLKLNPRSIGANLACKHTSSFTNFMHEIFFKTIHPGLG